MNLTTVKRVQAFSGITASVTTDAVLGLLIPMVSSQVARYLKRDLVLTTYRSWVDGRGCNTLMLPQYPVVNLYHACCSSKTVARVEALGFSMATISSDDAKLYLDSMTVDGVEAHNELPFTTHKTIQALATAIGAIEGWTASVDSVDYGQVSSLLIRPFSSHDALNGAADIVTADEPDRVSLADAGFGMIAMTAPYTEQRLQPAPTLEDRWPLDAGFPAGDRNIFVWYRAGYTLPSDTPNATWTLPEDLEMMVQQIVADTYRSRGINKNLASESYPGYSYSLQSGGDGAVASVLSNYKKELEQFRRKSI